MTKNDPKLPVDRLIYRRPMAEVLSDLSRPVPERMLATRQQGGKMLTYIPWHTVNRLLDLYSPGWEGRIKDIKITQTEVIVIYEITIYTQEGEISRQASGQETLDKPFGDTVCNAEQQAFKRAAARFGLGLDLYEE